MGAIGAYAMMIPRKFVQYNLNYPVTIPSHQVTHHTSYVIQYLCLDS